MWKAILLLTVLCPLVNCVCDGCSDYTPVDQDDPRFKEAVDLIVKDINNLRFTSKYHMKIAEMTGAEQSVCLDAELCGKGATYRFNATLGETNCLREEVSYENIADCEIQENTRITECRFKVYTDKKGEFYSTSISCRRRRES